MDFINTDENPLTTTITISDSTNMKKSNELERNFNNEPEKDIKTEIIHQNNVNLIENTNLQIISATNSPSGLIVSSSPSISSVQIAASSHENHHHHEPQQQEISHLINLDFDPSCTELNTKTGEIFMNENGIFIITCNYCIEKFLKLREFREHMLKIHLYLSEDIILTEADENTIEETQHIQQADQDQQQLEQRSVDIIDENTSTSVIYEIPGSSDLTGSLEQNEILLPSYTEEIIETVGCENELNTFVIPESTASIIGNTIDFEMVADDKAEQTLSQSEIIELIQTGKMKQLKAHLFRMPNLHYQCPICTHETTRFDFMLNHFKAVHMINDSNDKFICQYCNLKFARKSAYNTHVKTHTHPYKCQFCPFEFSNKSQLIYHQRFHLGERRFKCSECDERFVHEKERELHERLAHETVSADVLHLKDVWQCNICGKYFRSQRSLLQHRKTKKNCVYSCEFCEKRFFNDTDKLKHQASNCRT